MFDDLRQQADSSMMFDDEDADALEMQPRQRPFLGMTPVQRFVIALMLLVIVCILSSFCLVVSERVMLPFL
jgi:hypothetical protein